MKRITIEVSKTNQNNVYIIRTRHSSKKSTKETNKTSELFDTLFLLDDVSMHAICLIIFYQLCIISFTPYIYCYIRYISAINSQPLYNCYKIDNVDFFMNQKLGG